MRVLPDPLLLVSADGIVLDANPAFAKTFGWLRDDLAGARVAGNILDPESDLGRAVTAATRVDPSGVSTATVRTRAGQPVLCRSEAWAIDDPPGALLLRFRPGHSGPAALDEHRSRFLAAAAAALSSSLDYERTLRTIAQLAVPEIADWCAVDIIDEEGALQRVAVANVDPSKVALAERLEERYPEDPESPHSVHGVLRTGQPSIMRRIPAPADPARDTRGHIVNELGLTSFMRVPMLARGMAIGVLTFVSAQSRREYGETDLRFAQDVAWRAALAVENARAYAEARRANRLKDDFLATLSHELRTPLNAILGYTYMLQSSVLPEDRRPHALTAVARNATALNQIVEDILDVSRIVSGKIRVELTPLDMGSVVDDAVGSIAPAAEAKGLLLQVDTGASRAPVLGDAPRLQQVLWNVLTNAVKFTPAGGRVNVSLQISETNVTVVVEDTGVGISPQILPRVFERFLQADSHRTREHGGLGLGLAIALAIVELHGGTLTGASAGLGQGATFRLTLPRFRDTSTDGTLPRPLDEGESGTMAKYGKAASKSVESAVRREKKGTLKSGSGRKVTSRKQAIAIGLSEAREKGAKVPPRKSARKSTKKKSTKKSTSRSTKKTTRKSTKTSSKKR
jgi:signal transduction histidine kinase